MPKKDNPNSVEDKIRSYINDAADQIFDDIMYLVENGDLKIIDKPKSRKKGSKR